MRLFINQSTDDRSLISVTIFRTAVFKQGKRKHYIFLLQLHHSNFPISQIEYIIKDTILHVNITFVAF